MKKILSSLLLFIALFVAFTPVQEAKAQVDPRLKALGMMAAYGAVGGFLLGSASLAFDTPGRSPFIGASLGLYAGIFFGSYVVISHAVKKHQIENPGSGNEDYYPETPSSPYESPFSSDSGSSMDESGAEQRWRNINIGPRDESPVGRSFNLVKAKPASFDHPPIYLNLLRISF